MAQDTLQAGITDEPAPALGVTQWIDASGRRAVGQRIFSLVGGKGGVPRG